MTQFSTVFSENLALLPSVDHVRSIQLLDANQAMVADIENKPGSAGSVRVYYYLFQQFGAINPQAAEEGLVIYAEHTADAKSNAGKHPNIDRLFQLIEGHQVLSVKLMTA